MALSNETKAWLDGLKAEGSLSDDAYNSLRTSLEGSSKADDYVKGSQLRQADYSRVMSDVQKAQKAVEDAQNQLSTREEQVTKFQEDLGTWKQDADVNFQKAIREREIAANKSQAAIARLRSLAVANGLSEEEVLRDLDTVPVVETKVPDPIDTSRFVTRDQIAQTVAESALIDASIYDLSVEYQELTGKPLKNASQLVQEAIAAKKPLAAYVADKYKFNDLRAAQSEASVQRRIQEGIETGLTQRLSDAGLPGANAGLRRDLQGSPIFMGEGGALKPPSETGQGGGISAAVAAFNQGKFKANR